MKSFRDYVSYIGSKAEYKGYPWTTFYNDVLRFDTANDYLRAVRRCAEDEHLDYPDYLYYPDCYAVYSMLHNQCCREWGGL